MVKGTVKSIFVTSLLLAIAACINTAPGNISEKSRNYSVKSETNYNPTAAGNANAKAQQHANENSALRGSPTPSPGPGDDTGI